MVEGTIGNAHHGTAVNVVGNDEMVVGRRREAGVKARNRQVVVCITGVGQGYDILICNSLRGVVGIAFGSTIHALALVVGQHRLRVSANFLSPE